MTEKGVYLRENGECVGPFHTREDALRFLVLMELSGESIEGIEIVETDAVPDTGCPSSFTDS